MTGSGDTNPTPDASDVVERAKAALELRITPVFVAVARAVVPELVAEVTRLRRVTDIIDPDSVYREQAEHWKSLWRQNTATAADAMRVRDAAVAELRGQPGCCCGGCVL